MGKKYKKSLKVLLKVTVFLNGIERMLTQEPLQGIFKTFLVGFDRDFIYSGR
jgi:hypothetical protein